MCVCVPIKHDKKLCCRRQAARAVADRPRDASCLSVVIFNSTIRRMQSSVRGLLVTSALDLPLHTVKLFCSVLFVVVLHAAGCDKQESLMRRRLCGKLHRGLSQLFLALQQSLIR